MTIVSNKAIQKLFATGDVGNLKISIDKTPKIVVTAGNSNQSILRLNAGKDNDSWVLGRLKEVLTRSHIEEHFRYIAVDRNTEMTEERSLKLPLHDINKEVYEGVLDTPQIKAHINSLAYHAKQQEALLSAEERVGIQEKSTVHRLVFNIQGSASCEKEGYDRHAQGKYVDIYLNSNTGEWKAIKNSTCKASYAPLARLKPSDISDEELLELMLTNAPELKQ